MINRDLAQHMRGRGVLGGHGETIKLFQNNTILKYIRQQDLLMKTRAPAHRIKHLMQRNLIEIKVTN